MSAPIVVPSSSSSADGIDQTTYRRSIADEIGEYGAMVVSQTVSSSSSPDADRQVILIAAQGDTTLSGDRLGNYWMYVVDGDEAGESRRVVEGGHDGPFGSVILDRGFDSPLESGTTVEFTDSLPGSRWQTVKGLNDCVNEALNLVPVEIRVDLEGNGTRSVSLNDYPYIRRLNQIAGLYDWMTGSQSAGDPAEMVRFEYDLKIHGSDITLLTDWAYATDENFQLGVYAKGKNWIRDAGVWAYSTTGLTSATQEAAVELHWVRAFGCLKALQVMERLAARGRLAGISDGAAMKLRLDEIVKGRRKWAGACAKIIREDFPTPPQRVKQPLIGLSRDDADPVQPYTGGWP